VATDHTIRHGDSSPTVNDRTGQFRRHSASDRRTIAEVDDAFAEKSPPWFTKSSIQRARTQLRTKSHPSNRNPRFCGVLRDAAGAPRPGRVPKLRHIPPYFLSVQLTRKIHQT
jgi:hypothetical protein